MGKGVGKGEEGMRALLSVTTLAHAISGSLGSILAMTATYPLDLVRTIKQLEKDGENRSIIQVLKIILERHGWLGLFDGLRPMLIALGTSNFVYFYWFTALKTIYQYLLKRKTDRPGSTPIGPIANLLLASVAGAINVCITTPIWRAFMRISSEKLKALKNCANNKNIPTQYSGISDCMYKIYKDEGFSSLWTGLGPSLILCSNPSIQFASYEYFKKIVLKLKLDKEPAIKDYNHFVEILDDETDHVRSENIVGEQLNSFEYFLLGAGSKLVATIITYPLQIAQTRLRAEKSDKNKETGTTPNSTAQILKDILEKDGISGWFRGIEAKIVQTCLTSAFMFASYEMIVAAVLRFMLWRKYQKLHKQ